VPAPTFHAPDLSSAALCDAAKFDLAHALHERSPPRQLRALGSASPWPAPDVIEDPLPHLSCIRGAGSSVFSHFPRFSPCGRCLGCWAPVMLVRIAGAIV